LSLGGKNRFITWAYKYELTGEKLRPERRAIYSDYGLTEAFTEGACLLSYV
jgi:hypothetical protein